MLDYETSTILASNNAEAERPGFIIFVELASLTRSQRNYILGM